LCSIIIKAICSIELSAENSHKHKEAASLSSSSLLLTEQSSKNSYPTILVQKTQCLHHLLLQPQELSRVLDTELAELTTQIEEEEEENC
jgi:hypothetical protein